MQRISLEWWWVWTVSALGAAACTEGGLDADCDAPGRDLEVPAIRCPADVDLGCVPEAGLAADFAPEAAVCTGPAATTRCDPPSGVAFTAGETRVQCAATGGTGKQASCEFTVMAIAAGRPGLWCPPAARVECAGPRTVVELASPVLDERCGRALGPPAGDVPSDGFSLGSTTVRFTAVAEIGAPVECTTQIEVSDTVAPTIQCETTAVVARTSPELFRPPSPTPEDMCEPAVVVTASPDGLERGITSVTFTAQDAAGNRSSCDTRFEAVDAFSGEALRVVSADASMGRTRITLAWDGREAGFGVDATALIVERGDSPDGPWTPVAELPVTQRTFTDAELAQDRAYYRVVTMAGDLRGGVTASRTAYAVAPAEYRFEGQPVARFADPTTVYGIVRHPEDLGGGPFPLVVMIHGNRGNCRRTAPAREDACAPAPDEECPLTGWTTTPNARGLDYLAQTLAAQGFVVASIGANATNCRSGYIEQRAELVLAHLRRWLTWSREPGAPFDDRFVGAVDLRNVALLGHGAGGEAVVRAAEILGEFPVSGMSIRATLAIAPTEGAGVGVPDDVPFSVIVGTCDGVAFDLDGVRLYDRATIDLRRAEPRVQMVLAGANHNGFNSEWFDDDGVSANVCEAGTGLSSAAQRAALEGLVGAWLQSTVGDTRFEPFLQAEEAVPEGISSWAGTPLDLRVAFATRAIAVDRFDGLGTPTVNALGQPNGYTGFDSVEVCPGAGCNFPFAHARSAVRLRWLEAAGAVATFTLRGLDGKDARAISLRVTSTATPSNLGRSEHRLTLRVTSGDGIQSVPAEVGTRVPHLYEGVRPREVLQSVRIPFESLRGVAPRFDPARLETLELQVDGEAGELIITDIEVGD